MSSLLADCPAPDTCRVCAHALRAFELAHGRGDLGQANHALLLARRQSPACWSGTTMLEAATGAVAYYAQDRVDAAASLERALTFARRDTLPALRAEVEARVANALYSPRPSPETTPKLRECAANVLHLSRYASPTAQCRIAASMGFQYFEAGQIDRMNWWLKRARRYAELTGNADIGDALRRMAPIYEAWGVRKRALLGQPVGARDIDQAVHGLQEARRVLYPDAASYGYAQLEFCEALVLMMRDDFEACYRLLDHCLPIAIAHGMLDEATVALSERALCRLQAGERSGARADLDDAVRRVDQTSDAYVSCLVYRNVARFHRMNGEAMLARVSDHVAADWLRTAQQSADAIRAALRRHRGTGTGA